VTVAVCWFQTSVLLTTSGDAEVRSFHFVLHRVSSS